MLWNFMIVQNWLLNNYQMTLPVLASPRDSAAPRPDARRALIAAAVIMLFVSVALFAALSASGDPAIVAPLGTGGPYADLHHTVHPALLKAACWVAAVTGGAGILAGLAAVRRGWLPRQALILAACAAATLLLVFVPPAASVDVQNYAEYGRIVILHHNPWVMTPQQLFQRHDPVGLLAPPEWRGQPTVYGPAATLVEAVAARLGGASMAWITFWIKVMNGICYLAVAAVLDRLAGPDPARRARVALLWAVNPLMLFWMVAGGHTDLLAVLPLLLAVLAVRKLRRREDAGADGPGALAAGTAGVLAGIAIAVKVTFAGPVLGLAVGLRHVVSGRRRTTVLAAGIAGGAIVLAVGYSVAGLAAWKSLSQRLSSANDSFLPLPAGVYLHPALYSGVTLAAFVIVGSIFAWRMPPGHADLPEIRPMLICALALVLGDIVQYPWYDAMFFPLLALLPASRLDGWLVARTVVISGLLLPGIGITTEQYREVRVAVPVFMACLLAAAALGKLRPRDEADGVMVRRAVSRVRSGY
jgi:hypothetical protein